MALRKELILSSGVTTNHHRIISSNIDWKDKMLILTVGHYIDVNTRSANREPVDVTRYRIIGEGFPLENGGITQNEMYEYLKTLPEYEGAEDEIVE